MIPFVYLICAVMGTWATLSVVGAERQRRFRIALTEHQARTKARIDAQAAAAAVSTTAAK